MSIASAIQLKQQQVVDAYTAISNKGGTLPATQNLANMPTAINSIPSGGETITATSISSAAINSGEKVWVNEEDGEYNIIDFSIDNRNFTTVGNPTITNKIASNLSSSNYIKFPVNFVPSSNHWEINVKINTGEYNSSQQYIMYLRKVDNFSSSDRYGLGIGINGQKAFLFISTSGSSWEIDDVFGTYTYLDQTDYWLKFGWNGTQYYLEYSTDGETYTRDITINDSTPVSSSLQCGYFGIFLNTSATDFFNGSVYLADTDISINNSVIWTAYGQEISESSFTGKAVNNIEIGGTGSVERI